MTPFELRFYGAAMEVDYKKVFTSHLKDVFAPALRGMGFKGSGAHFRRFNGEVINTICIQGNRYGGKCAVNLGLHLTFLPLNWKDELPKITTIKEIECEFRTRLAPENEGDYWWEYGGLLEPPSKNATHLCETYIEWGEPLFRSYDSVEAIANMFSLEQLRESHYLKGFGDMTVPRAALAMARIHAHLGKTQRAAEYARVGLEKLGNASALTTALEQLARADDL